MTRTRRFLGGVWFGYLNQVVVTIAGLWLTPFFLRNLGSHEYGLWFVGAQILGYLMLMDLGVTALLPRETAFATGRGGGSWQTAGELQGLVGRTTRIVLWQTPVVGLVAAAIWLSFSAGWAELRIPIGVVMAAFVLLFPLRICQAVLQGLQDLAFLGRVQLASWLIGTVLSVALVRSGAGLYGLAIGWAATQLASAVLCAYRLRKRYPGVLPIPPPRLSLTGARTYLRSSLWVSVAQVAQVLLNGTDLLIIAKLVGPAFVVMYVCTGKLITVLANQPQLIMQAALPGMSEIRASESRARLLRVSMALTQAMLLLSGLVVCVVLAVNRGFVGWWVGEAQYGGFTLSLLLLVSMLLRHWNTTAVYTNFCFGHERRISVTTLLDGVVTVAASVVLIQRLGLPGAPLASILGVCLVSLPANLWVSARESRTSFLGLVKPLWPWFWRFTLVGSVAAWIGIVRPPVGVLATILASLVLVGVYSVVMIPVAVVGPLGSYLRPRLKSLGESLRRRKGGPAYPSAGWTDGV